MAGRGPPPFLNTEDDRGAIVAVVSFTAIAVSTFTNSIRLINRQQSEASLGLDDVLLVAANITAIVQTVLVSASIKNGLGQHFDSLSGSSIAAYHKFSYASSILAILAMAFSKVSVLQLQQRLCGIQPTSRYIKVMHQALTGSIMLWAVFSVFALAFQCGIKNPYAYEPDRCADGVLWYPITVINAITDAALAFSFSPIIIRLAARTKTKVRVMILLGTRLLVCVATIVQIASLSERLTAANQTRAMMKLVILQQVVMNLSILTAVVLGLHSFIANLTAGGFGVEVRDSTNELSNRTYLGSRRDTGVGKTSSRPHGGSHAHTPHRRLSRVGRVSEGLRLGKGTQCNAWAQHEEVDGWDESDGRSHSSQENIIMQTVTWQVERDAAVASSSSIGHAEQTLPSHGESREASTKNFVV